MLTNLTTFRSFLDELSSMEKISTPKGFVAWLKRATPRQVQKAKAAFEKDLSRRMDLPTSIQKTHPLLDSFKVNRPRRVGPLTGPMGGSTLEHPQLVKLDWNRGKELQKARKEGFKATKHGVTRPTGASHKPADRGEHIRLSKTPRSRIHKALEATRRSMKKRKIPNA